MKDLINRQAAIEALEQMNHVLDSLVQRSCGDKFYVAEKNQAEFDINIIKKLPSAQQDDCQKCIFSPFKQFKEKQKVGRWYDKTDNAYAGGGYTECSACGDRYSWGVYFEVNNFRFCPKCGAKMRKE